MLSEALVPIRMRPATRPRSRSIICTAVSSSRTARALRSSSSSPARVATPPLAHALDHGQSERCLELADLHADGGLSEPELGGSAREAPVANHRVEGPHLSQRERQIHTPKRS